MTTRDKIKEILPASSFENRIALYFTTHENAFIRHNPDSTPYPGIQATEGTLGELSEKLSEMVSLRLESLIAEREKEMEKATLTVLQSLARTHGIDDVLTYIGQRLKIIKQESA